MSRRSTKQRRAARRRNLSQRIIIARWVVKTFGADAVLRWCLGNVRKGEP